MKHLSTFSLLLGILLFYGACTNTSSTESISSSDGLEIIKVDLSEAREGKLSEFFEPEIEYIWLKDDSEEAQVRGLNKIFFHEDKIFTLDIIGCHCIKIFDRSGKFLSKIRAYGEGPEKYLDFADAIIVNEEVLLLGVFPLKQMWFSLDGKFLREEKLAKHIGSAVFSEEDKRYYLHSKYRGPGEYFVESVDESFQDTIKFFPFHKAGFYGNLSGRNIFQKSKNSLYFAMPFNDTIYQVNAGKFIPKLAFDFGVYGRPIDELKRNSERLNLEQQLDFLNKNSQLYFVSSLWFITEFQLYSAFYYKAETYNVFFDRKSQMTRVIKGRISDDLNEGFDPYSIFNKFGSEKVGFNIHGKTLFKSLQKKKAELGQAGFEDYVRGKGKNFALTAFAAKDSENPVLIVYTVKK